MAPLLATGVLTTVTTRILTSGFLIVMMFAMGLEVGGEPPKTREAKRRGRRLLARALVVNLVVLPLIAFALVRGLHRSGVVATALLIVAATPGGRFAPHLAKIAAADLGLSVEITLFLAKLTGFTAPVTIKWLIGVPRIEVHDLILIAQLVALQLLPYLVGKRLRRARPDSHQRLARPLVLVEAALGLSLLVYFVARGALGGLRAAGPVDWGAGLAFALVALAIGWLAGGPSREARRAVAVTASARNLALGLMIAGQLFPEGPVPLALFGLWVICAAADCAFALAARGPRRSPQPALG